MYEGWKIEKWVTPISDITKPSLEYLSQDKKELKIKVIGDNSQSWLFLFDFHCPAYKSTDESYRMELWSYLDQTNQRSGSTFIVKNSSWLKYYQESEILASKMPDLKHYAICTNNNIIEILASKEPQIIVSNS